MDKFRNRVKYYMLGLGFGTLIVYFMFGNRGCSWLPANRVKNMIGEKEILVGDSVLASMECFKLNNDDIYALLKDEGNVEFSKSITDKNPKIYYIEGKKDENIYFTKFALYEDPDPAVDGYAEVAGVGVNGMNDCNVQISNKKKSTLPLPHADVIAILESQEFRILERAECQMEHYGIAKEDLMVFHKTATIDIEQSEPRLILDPFYVMKGELNSRSFSVKYITGENRTRIHSIVGGDRTNCSE